MVCVPQTTARGILGLCLTDRNRLDLKMVVCGNQTTAGFLFCIIRSIGSPSRPLSHRQKRNRLKNSGLWDTDHGAVLTDFSNFQIVLLLIGLIKCGG